MPLTMQYLQYSYIFVLVSTDNYRINLNSNFKRRNELQEHNRKQRKLMSTPYIMLYSYTVIPL